MTRLSLDSAPDTSGTLLCGLTPSGRIDIYLSRALLSYYSSHEGNGTSQPPSAIFLAELSLG